MLEGLVRTFDEARPWAPAIAVRDGSIVAVGTTRECREAAGPHAEVLRAALVLPGFVDCHVHPLQGGLDLIGCDLHQADTAAGYLDLVARFAAAHPDEPWITGGGWVLPAFPGGLATAAELDAVTGDRPAYLMNTDRHGAWVNSAALRRAGIDATTPDPPDGRIERDQYGQPTGMLHEGAAGLVASTMPRLSPEHLRSALLAAQAQLHAAGITAWQDAIVGEYLGYPDALPVYCDLAASGDLTATVELALWWDRNAWPGQLAALLARRRIAAIACLSANTVKIMVDGIVENRSAALHRPYLSGAGDADAGSTFLDPDELVDAVAAVAGAGFAAHLHAIGDRAVTDALDAMAALPESGASPDGGPEVTPGRQPRHHIAHLQLVAPQDIPRFAALGVTANLQMLWAAEDDQVRDLCRPLLGDDRVEMQYPFASLLAAGAPLVTGSDWPVSTPAVLDQIQVGVTRRPVEHRTAPRWPSSRRSPSRPRCGPPPSAADGCTAGTSDSGPAPGPTSWRLIGTSTGSRPARSPPPR